MPTDQELDELKTDARVALRDLQLIAASVRELVERAEAGALTGDVRNEIVPTALDAAEAVYTFLLEQAAQLVVEVVAA